MIEFRFVVKRTEHQKMVQYQKHMYVHCPTPFSYIPRFGILPLQSNLMGIYLTIINRPVFNLMGKCGGLLYESASRKWRVNFHFVQM